MKKTDERKNKSVVYSALEAANLCGVVNQTAINWIRAGHLKAFTTPGGQFRIYPEDLAEFMESRDIHIPQELQEVLDSRKSVSTTNAILIVDDDKAFNDITTKYLMKNLPEAKIYQAFDGFEAGSLFFKTRPDYVILDLNLPGVDGIEVCRKIREEDKNKKTEVIIITAMQDEESEARCRALGVARYIRKPVSLPELLEVINTI
jgi:excisionase family DNA binding protein